MDTGPGFWNYHALRHYSHEHVNITKHHIQFSWFSIGIVKTFDLISMDTHLLLIAIIERRMLPNNNAIVIIDSISIVAFNCADIYVHVHYDKKQGNEACGLALLNEST